ncbi:YdcF family protein [Paenibacillus senegalensis]|uniref:YdcF family protein n=1 Tax=Paenibacillus senegalensis TaxID=1465766 RepID=UPI0002882D0F|nr:YdcF family protein [Paenibacillus senegalensis]
MMLSELSLEQVTIDNRELIDRVLFSGIEDDGKNGELLFVFGSTKAVQYRVPLAVELYMAKRAPKLLMSGGNRPMPGDEPEAILMMRKAAALGVPSRDMIAEIKSTHTAENVTESKALLEKLYDLRNIHRILVVSNAYHMRRCYLTLKTFLPQHIEYTLCPANDLNTRRDNWWQNEKGTERVLQETKKLIRYTREGKLHDYSL